MAFCPGGKGGEGHGEERDDESCTTYRFPGEHVAIAWLCVWAIRPTTTTLRVFMLVTRYRGGALSMAVVHLPLTCCTSGPGRSLGRVAGGVGPT